VNENRLLVVDDDSEVGAFFGQVGEDLGFETKVLLDPNQFAQTILDFSPTVPCWAGSVQYSYPSVTVWPA